MIKLYLPASAYDFDTVGQIRDLLLEMEEPAQAEKLEKAFARQLDCTIVLKPDNYDYSQSEQMLYLFQQLGQGEAREVKQLEEYLERNAVI